MKARADSAVAFRLGLLLLSGAFAVAAFFPDLALAPIDALVARMRAPESAPSVARAFFMAAAAGALAVALLHRRLVEIVQRAVAAIDAWSAQKFWIVAAVVAGGVRVLAFLLPYEPTSDAYWYHAAAVSLAHGDGVAVDGGPPTAFRSPGYPFVLSLLYRSAGDNVQLAWVLGMICSAVLLFGVHSVGRRLYGETVARVATLSASVYPALVLMTPQAMSELLFTAGLFGVFAWMLRVDGSRRRDALLLGIACGLLTLVRSAALGLFVVLPLSWWLRTRDWRTLLRNILLGGVVSLACLLPWMLRNAVELGRFTIGTNAGSNLYVGNHPGASGGYEAPDFPELASANGEVESDELMKAEVLRFVRQHPVEALALVPRKFVAMYLLETQAVSSAFQGEHPGSNAIRHALFIVSQGAWVVVALLVLVHLASWRNEASRPRGEQWFGWWLVLYFTAVCLVFHGEDRYRLPVLPWFLIVASLCVNRAAGRSAR